MRHLSEWSLRVAVGLSVTAIAFLMLTACASIPEQMTTDHVFDALSLRLNAIESKLDVLATSTRAAPAKGKLGFEAIPSGEETAACNGGNAALCSQLWNVRQLEIARKCTGGIPAQEYDAKAEQP